MAQQHTLNINGNQSTLDPTSDIPLLWYLRETLSLTGTKFGCGIGSCGACTVHVNGRAVRSCSVTAKQLSGQSVTTIEGLANGDGLHPVQQAWLEFNVAQCGYCQAGQIMAVADFLSRFPAPTDDDIDQNLTNLCRCGTYTRMRQAIHYAASLIGKAQGANS